MIPLSDQHGNYDEEERAFLGELLARRIFGAIYSALIVRARDSGLTRKTFGDRIGSEKTSVSKLLKSHGNWKTQRLSDVSNALDLDVEVCLIDRHNPYRVFTSRGEHYISASAVSYDTNEAALAVIKNLYVSPPSASSLGRIEAVNGIRTNGRGPTNQLSRESVS